VYSRPMRVAALAGLVALALVAAGCGGKRLSQSEFQAQTSAICAGYTERAQKELAPANGNPLSPNARPEELARFGRLLEHVATLFSRQLADLSEVRPPGESAERYSQVLRLYRKIENAISRAARAARRGDKPGVARAEEELSALGQEADALGFKCE
jgi:hypothetical protein